MGSFKPTFLKRDAHLTARLAGLPAPYEVSWTLEAEKRCGGDPPAIRAGFNWAHTARAGASAASGAAEGRAMGYLYLNSELIGSGEVSLLNMDAESVCAYLGISCYDMLFRASYDEVHIWKHVLDESQISSMYTAYIAA